MDLSGHPNSSERGANRPSWQTHAKVMIANQSPKEHPALRRSHRVHFPGHRSNKLSGILEFPPQEPRGWFLFSHCFTCNKDLKAIVRISRGLAERGWGVLRYDFSGLGGSEGDFSETNFTTQCEDLQSAAEYLSAEVHAPRFLIGHSFGGAASLAMAEELSSVMGVIAIAAPSDTCHLAKLLLAMNPAIESEGQGTVSIGGLTHTITKQMTDNFQSYDLPSRVALLRKPLLVFHSPEDDTVPYYHAQANLGFQKPLAGSAGPLFRLPSRSLIALPGSNHLLTSSDRDLQMVMSMIDAWCDRLI
jgi:putative redox protein